MRKPISEAILKAREDFYQSNCNCNIVAIGLSNDYLKRLTEESGVDSTVVLLDNHLGYPIYSNESPMRPIEIFASA